MANKTENPNDGHNTSFGEGTGVNSNQNNNSDFSDNQQLTKKIKPKPKFHKVYSGHRGRRGRR